MSQFGVVRLQCVTLGRGWWESLQEDSWMAANLHGTNGFPVLWLTTLVLHSTEYLNICRHPRGGEIVPDPLISSPASKMGDCLMKMDHSDGFTFHIWTASVQLYYGQSSPLSSTLQTTYSACSLHLCVCLSFLSVLFFWGGGHTGVSVLSWM